MVELKEKMCLYHGSYCPVDVIDLNAFGTAGTEQADRIAIATLLPNKLDDQVCFTSQASVNALKYVGSEKYGA